MSAGGIESRINQERLVRDYHKWLDEVAPRGFWDMSQLKNAQDHR